MIRFIAALDDKRGIANEHGIPWLGKIPSDAKQYRQKISTGIILMGIGHYNELQSPYPRVINYVANQDQIPLRAGFLSVLDAHSFLETHHQEEVWNIGGALLYESTIDLADELYLTRLKGDFGCTKFFPAFEAQFERVNQQTSLTENNITFHFEIWRRK